MGVLVRNFIKNTTLFSFTQVKATDIMLKSLPPPTEQHCNVVSRLIAEVFKKHGLSAAEIEKRHQVVAKIYEVILPKIPGMLVQSMFK